MAESNRVENIMKAGDPIILEILDPYTFKTEDAHLVSHILLANRSSLKLDVFKSDDPRERQFLLQVSGIRNVDPFGVFPLNTAVKKILQYCTLWYQNASDCCKYDCVLKFST